MRRVRLPPELANRDSPPDWDAVFGFDGPIEIEIGSGHGGFAAGYAARHPGVRLVAIEKRRKYADQTAVRAGRRGLVNVAVVCAPAELAVGRLFVDGALAAVHIHFPDPWWKRRHTKRRFLTERFAALLWRKLARGGRVDVRTDVAERAFEIARVFEGAGFKNLHGEFAFAPHDPGEVPSSREVRYLESGEPVYRLRLVRP